MDVSWMDSRIEEQRGEGEFRNWVLAFASVWHGDGYDYSYEEALEHLLDLLRPNFGDPHLPEAVGDCFADSYGDAVEEARDMAYFAFGEAWGPIMGEQMRVFTGADLRDATLFCVGVDYSGVGAHGGGSSVPEGRLIFSHSSMSVDNFVVDDEEGLRRLYRVILEKTVV